MAYSRRSYKGAPIANAIGGSTLAAGATSITLASSISGSWSTGSAPFFIVIDPGTAKEEKVCVIYNTSTNLVVVNPAVTSGWTANVAGRGADDTTDRQHDIGAVVYPVFTATEANQANELVSKFTTNGDLVTHGNTGLKTVATGGSGNNNKILTADSTVDGGIKWSSIATASIADGAITSDKILDNTIVAGDIADGAITSAKILDNTIVLGDLAAALQAFLVPVGSINAYAGATAPTGWLLCDGVTSTTGKPILAALVGATTPDLRGKFPMGKTTSGTGSTLLGSGGTTTIAIGNLPSHNHTNTASASTSVTVDAGGGHSHTASSTSAGNHSHLVRATVISGSHFHDNTSSTDGYISSGTNGAASAGSGLPNAVTAAGDHSHTITVDGVGNHSHTASASTTVTMTNAFTGSDTAYYQPFLAVNYIIKHD